MFEKVSYADLNPRQKEGYNFQKVSAVLADHGFMTIRLSDDWNGADFIAQHVDGKTFLKIQLKSALTFDKKYEGKDLYICFPDESAWYIYPHDELLRELGANYGIVVDTDSWKINGNYHFPSLSKNVRRAIEKYRLEAKKPPTGVPEGFD